jgi:hypothetical protein
MIRRLVLLVSCAAATYSLAAMVSLQFDPLEWAPTWQAAFLGVTLGSALVLDALIGADHDEQDGLA